MKNLLAFLLITFSTPSLLSQSLNYREIFGKDWDKAANYVSEAKDWMEPLIVKNNISYSLAIAVIFPELVRYSALRDKMEITLLKTLYINLGNDYANFSIGQFQMKPSFAEMIREQSYSALGRKSDIRFKKPSEYESINKYRHSIIADLEDPPTQLNYLIAFLKICEKRYKLSLEPDSLKLKFLATAYNFGFDKTKDQIISMTNRKFFNTSLIKTDNYSYSDVSLFWYNHFNPVR